MIVKRLDEAVPYTAPNHAGCVALRLQGFEPGGPDAFWTGLSHFLPGGGAGPDASPLEKVYVIVKGRMRVKADGQDVELGPLDSCTIGANVEREIVNASNEPASMLVVMPYPEPV